MESTKPYTWAIWDGSRTPYSDEASYATRGEALAAMKEGAAFVYEPIRYAIREYVDEEAIRYHYYRPIADGEFYLYDTMPLVSRRIYDAQKQEALSFVLALVIVAAAVYLLAAFLGLGS